MSPLTRLTDIQLSLIHVNPLSDVPILDTLMSFAYVRRHASFPLASHLAVSSNAVRVGYAVVRFNRVRIELTFYHYSLKRTHNLGLEGGPNFRWQYKNREISSIRIRVEHAIRGIKRYRIVKDKLRNSKKGFSDLVMETCCGLHNFRLNFRPWSYHTHFD